MERSSNNALEMIAAAADPLRVGFVLVPDFPMMTFGAAVRSAFVIDLSNSRIVEASRRSYIGVKRNTDANGYNNLGAREPCDRRHK
ncbi:hypothetical protein OH764_26955 [Burkholderia sp. M6-3]